jgi:hypothetical protein
MNPLRRLLLAYAAIFGGAIGASSAGILQDVSSSAESGASALSALGYKADFTFESIMELERFMSDNVNDDGGAKPGSEFESDTGGKLFILGAYLGEVIRRRTNGTWRGNDSDPEATVNVEVNTEAGATIWPIQRIMKRFKNGSEDNLWVYAQHAIEP